MTLKKSHAAQVEYDRSHPPLVSVLSIKFKTLFKKRLGRLNIFFIKKCDIAQALQGLSQAPLAFQTPFLPDRPAFFQNRTRMEKITCKPAILSHIIKQPGVKRGVVT